MNVLKIVVGKLPKNCYECCLNKQNNTWHKCLLTGSWIESIEFQKDRLPDCPLVVEEVCEYVGEYGGCDEQGDMTFFTKRTGCSDEHYQKIVVPDYKFCPNCGKPIKYVEEE